MSQSGGESRGSLFDSFPATSDQQQRGQGKKLAITCAVLFYVGLAATLVPVATFLVLRYVCEGVVASVSPQVLGTFLHAIKSDNFSVGVEFMLPNPFPLKVQSSFSVLDFDLPASPDAPFEDAGKSAVMTPSSLVMHEGNNTLRASLMVAGVNKNDTKAGIYKCVTGTTNETCWIRLRGKVNCLAQIGALWIGPGPLPFSYNLALTPLSMGNTVSLRGISVDEEGKEDETMFRFRGSLSFQNPSTLQGRFPPLPLALVLPEGNEVFANVTMTSFLLGLGENALDFIGTIDGEVQKANESVFFVNVIEGRAVDVIAVVARSSEYTDTESNWLQDSLVGVPMTIHVFPKHAIDLAVDELVFVSDNETIYQITVRTVVTIQNPTSIVGQFSFMEMELYSEENGVYLPVSRVVMGNFSLEHGSRVLSAEGIIDDDRTDVVKGMLFRFMNSNPSHCRTVVTKPELLRGFQVDFDLPGLPGSIIDGLALNLDGSSIEELLRNFSAQGEACVRNPLTFPITVESFTFSIATYSPTGLPSEELKVADVAANATLKVDGVQEAPLPLFVPADTVKTLPLHFPLSQIENFLHIGEWYLSSLVSGPSCGPMCLFVSIKEGNLELKVGGYAVTLPFGCEYQPNFCNISLSHAFDNHFCAGRKP